MTPFIRVYGCGCLIVLALLGDPAQQYGQQDAVTEKVLAAWSKRQSQTEKIEIEVAQKWLWPKGSKVPTPDKNGKTWPSQDFTGLQKYTLSLENEKLRYHYDGEMYFHFESQDRDGLTKNGFTVNFDGERELSLHTQGNTRHGSREQRERSFFAGSHELIPLMLCFRGPVESYQTIRLSQYRSTGRKVKHEGSSCLEFTLADPKPSVQAYILIEDSPDYPGRTHLIPSNSL